jgi:aspartyl protease family protein
VRAPWFAPLVRFLVCPWGVWLRGDFVAFIGVALLIAAGIVLLLSADAGSLVGLTQDQSFQLVPLLIILVMVAAGAFGRRIHLGQMLSGAVLWAGLFAVVITGYSYRYELADISTRVLGELAPGVAVVGEPGLSATFRKGFSNTFVMGAQVNGAKIQMIFDTGASIVVLTTDDARAAGIDLKHLRFTIPVQTANGMGKAAATRLDTIDVGGIVRNNIRAFVAEPGALETSLLGMTFLQTLRAYTVRQNALELQG